MFEDRYTTSLAFDSTFRGISECLRKLKTRINVVKVIEAFDIAFVPDYLIKLQPSILETCK